jgi:phage terminase small subunit
MDIPEFLKEQGKNFYQKVAVASELEEEIDLKRLEMAAGCYDVILISEKRVEADGHFVKDRYGQLKEHPALKTIRENKTVFCRIIRELGLDLEIEDSRPPRQY